MSSPFSTEVESAGANTPFPTWSEINPADLVLKKDRRPIGEGSLGCVYEGSWLGLRVAAKEIHMDELSKLEASILAELQSPFIVHLIGTCIKDSRLYLVMELVSSNLEQLLENRFNGDKPPLSLLVAVDIMLQISRAMEYLHSQGIMHLDLKASNVLFELSSVPELKEEGYGRAKLCDFGTASPKLFSFRDRDYTKGTNFCRAPEVFPWSYDDVSEETNTPEKYTRKADVYSFAMTCCQILMGKQPFAAVKDRDIYTRIRNGERPTFDPSICPFILANYIQRCWDTNPDQRPCFEAVSKFLRKLKLFILKSQKKALYRGFDPYFGFVDNENESIFAQKLKKWKDGEHVAMHSRLDEMLFRWRFLSFEMRRGIAIDIASFIARIHGKPAKEFLDLCLDSSTIYLDWNLKPIFSGVASGKTLRIGKIKEEAKRVEEFKNTQDFGRILVELSTGCTWKDMPCSLALIQREIDVEDLQPEFVDQQLVEEMEKQGKRQLLEEVLRWCKIGLWCQSPSHQPNIHKVLKLLKEGAPIDLWGDYLSSIPGSLPTKEEIIDSLQAVSNTADLRIIKQVLEEKWIKRSIYGESSAAMWTSLITSGAKFLYFLEYHTSKFHDKEVLFYMGNTTVVANITTEVTIGNILDKIGKRHWVVAGLVLPAFMIEMSQKVSASNAEALELLRTIVELATTLVEFKYVIPEEVENLKKAVMLVVQGSRMLVSQIPSEKSFRFLETSVNFEKLKEMSNRLDHIYKHLTLAITAKDSVIRKNAKRLSILLPVPKRFYRKNAVGIGNSQK